MTQLDLFGVAAKARASMGAHESNTGGTDQWLTPPELIKSLGEFDLDPCAPITRPWPTADRHFTIEDDGLRQDWQGRVWLNPPYASAARWLSRMAAHGNGIALLFARTETRIWQEHVWPHAHTLLFLEGRLTFCLSDGRHGNGSAGAPSVLIAYSARDSLALANCGWGGALVSVISSTQGRRLAVTA